MKSASVNRNVLRISFLVNRIRLKPMKKKITAGSM